MDYDAILTEVLALFQRRPGNDVVAEPSKCEAE
jgi:hypothetical protein